MATKGPLIIKLSKLFFCHVIIYIRTSATQRTGSLMDAMPIFKLSETISVQ